MAITDTLDGHQYAQNEYAQDEGIGDLCTALVYDAEIENVIDLIKAGNSPKAIQEWLDFRWNFSPEQPDNTEVPELIYKRKSTNTLTKHKKSRSRKNNK